LAAKINDPVKSVSFVSASHTPCTQYAIVERREQMLSTWIEHCNQQNVYVSLLTIQVKHSDLVADKGEERRHLQQVWDGLQTSASVTVLIKAR
jgi:hypothetical protein